MERKEIELIPQAAPGGRGAVLSFWAKAVGIPLIAILQLLFLSVFAFRLKIELDLRSLAASVDEKEAILEQSADFETAFRDTQARLNLIAATEQEFCYSCAIQKINALTPIDVALTSVTLSAQTASVSAEAPQGIAFASFVANILEEDTVQEASITSGAIDQDGNFVFSLELTLDREKLKEEAQ